MKRLFLVCLTLLLCMSCVAVLAEETECTEHNYTKLMYDGAQHWYACEVCEAEQENSRAEHYAACTNKGVCVVCSYENLDIGIAQSLCDFKSRVYVDRDYHAWACSNCGNFYYNNSGELDKEEHTRLCNADTCWACGVTDCNWSFISHNIPDPIVWKDMGETHGVPCSDCGECDEGSIESHTAMCTDQSVCYTCGHANPEKVWHSGLSSTWTDLGTTHGQYCSDCQKYVNEGAHQVSCSEPGKCTVCDLEVEGVELTHASRAMVSDETHHWVGCSVCKEPFEEKETHFTYCSQEDQTICCGCWETVDAANIRFDHDFEDTPNHDYDESVHWDICWCGESVSDYKDEHYRDCQTDACYCGYADVEVSHSWKNERTYNTTHCWIACSRCDEKNDYRQHYIDAIDGVTCIECMATNVTGECAHLCDGDLTYYYDDTQHWHVCIGENCKQPFYFGDHTPDCQGICTVCGKTGLAPIDHVTDWNYDDGYDEKWHWDDCNVCGAERLFASTHWVDCGETTCSICGAVNVQGPGNHNVTDADLKHDENRHWYNCPDCLQEVNVNEHLYSCLDHACVTCGYVNQSADVTHSVETWGVYTYNDDQHYQMCIVCKQGFAYNDHVKYCSSATQTCAVCDAENVNCKITHTGETIWQHDDTTHWMIWSCCKAEYKAAEAHNSVCTDKTTCRWCNAENITANVTHNSEYKVWNDENVHWNGCVDCGNPVGDKIKHYVSCDSTDRSVCSVCGIAVDPDTIGIAHTDIENPEVEYDENNHWRKLCACGESFEMDTHWASCAAPDAGCAICGYTGSDMPAYHALGSATYIDEQYHEEACARCDHKQTETHWSSSCLSNICEICEAEFVNTNPSHSWADDSIQSDADNHWYVCLECNENVELAAHTDVNKDDQCDVCKTQLVHKHSWGEPVTVPATCTADGSKTTTCGTCGEQTVETIASTGHAWGEPVTVPATCTADGSKTTNCGTCGEQTVETIASTGHAWGEPVTVPATCTADGSKTTACATCGEKTVETIKATGHAWGEPVTVPATCTADGSKTTTCGTCGEKTVETIKSAGHAWGEPVTVTATCTADGSKTTACATCGEKTVETIASAGHAWGEPVTVPATCTADGSKTTTCGTCGEKTVETIASAGHAWGEPVTVPATCTADGSKTTTCGACGEKTVETIKSAGHAWGEPVTVPATCTADGSKTTTCGTCGEKTTETITSLGGHKWKTVENVAATCTANGRIKKTCTVCNVYTISTPAAKGHAWGEPVTIPATCTADGSKTIACANCDEKTVEVIASTGHVWGETVTVEATCTTDGSTTTTCANCSEKIVETIASTGHTWGEPVTVPATCTADGSTTTTCGTCGETTVEAVTSTGHAYGLVYTTQNNGTHTKTCADCGAVLTAKCTLTTTNMGSMTCSACAICGYTVYTFNESAVEQNAEAEKTESAPDATETESADKSEETVPVVTEAKAETVVKRVENVSFELVIPNVEEPKKPEAAAEDTAVTEPAETVEPDASTEAAEEADAVEAESEPAPADYSDVVLVVHETKVEMAVELPDTVTAEVKKVLAVSMLKEGNSIQPAATVKLSIPVVEEEMAGLKLVLMTEDGSLVELEYEVIDGVIVFATDMVGVFLFVDAEVIEA